MPKYKRVSTLAIHEKMLGEEHPDTDISYNNLAKVYASQGRNEIAVNYFCLAFNVCFRKLGADQPHTKILCKKI